MAIMQPQMQHTLIKKDVGQRGWRGGDQKRERERDREREREREMGEG